MEIFLIIFGIVILLLLLAGYCALWVGLNSRCLEKYQFQPLNGWSVFAATLTALGLYVGVGMIVDAGGIPPLPWSEALLHSQAANGLVLAAAGGLIACVTIVSLISKTSLLNGLMAALLLAIAGTLFFLVIAFFVLLLFSDTRKRKVYVEY